MKSNYTVGPWRLTFDEPSGNWYIPDIEATIPALDIDTEEELPQAKANAMLVTAAPVLLSACRFALSVLNANPVELSERVAITRLTAAIAEATGESIEVTA